MPEFYPLMAVAPQIPPQFLILIVVLIVGPIVLGWIVKSIRKLGSKPSRTLETGLFEACPYLLSKGEYAFFAALEQAVLGQFRIAFKVRLADIVRVRGSGSAATSARNKTNQKHVDFALCTQYPVKVILVIELDDRTHERPDRRDRDVFVDECLQEAGVPVLHVPCRQAYDVAQLWEDVYSRIEKRAAIKP